MCSGGALSVAPTWNFLYKKMPLTEFSTVPVTCCPPVPGLGYLCMPTAVGWDCCTYTQPQDRIPAQIYSDVLPIFCVQTHGMIKAGSSLWVFSNSRLLKMKNLYNWMLSYDPVLFTCWQSGCESTSICILQRLFCAL